MKLLKPICGFLLSLFILNGYSQNEINPQTLFPVSGQFEGWSLADSVKAFVPDELYNHVGETSELYSEYGISGSMAGLYVDALAVRISLEVFAMNDPGGAWGIYTMNTTGKGKDEKIGDIATSYDHYLHFVKGRFYIRCTTSNRADEYLSVVRKMCEFADGKIPDHAKRPYVLLAFEFDDPVITDQKYFRGQVGLNEIFEFGHGSIAGFDEGGSGRQGEKLFFLLSYSDERKRREWFASARGKVKMEQNQRFTDYQMNDDGFTAKDKNGVTFSFKPWKNFIFILRGYNWSEGQAVFDRMAANLDKATP